MRHCKHSSNAYSSKLPVSLRTTSSTGLPRSTDRRGATGAAAGYNPASNRNYNITYDAAGNVLSDGNYSYSYDAEGNPVQAGQASYVYDAANRRVRVVTSSTNWTEYLFDPSGQRASSWIPNGPGGCFGNEGPHLVGWPIDRYSRLQWADLF